MLPFKPFKLILLLTLVSTISLSQPSRLSIGGGIIYGDEIEEIGWNFRALYNLSNGKICFGPEYTFFRKNGFFEGEDKITIDLYEINLNAHYIFRFTERLAYYPVIGFNFSVEEEENKDNGDREMEKAAGLNLGSGLHYEISHRFIAYVEFDRLFSSLSENSYTAGILLNLWPRSKGHEHPEED
ncbi:MAG: outer membrane beta-barrel protein [Bacteroidota bacterium]